MAKTSQARAPWKCGNCKVKKLVTNPGQEEAADQILKSVTEDGKKSVDWVKVATALLSAPDVAEIVEYQPENVWECSVCWNCKTPRPRPDKPKLLNDMRRLLSQVSGDPYITESEQRVLNLIHTQINKLDRHYTTGLNILID